MFKYKVKRFSAFRIKGETSKKFCYKKIDHDKYDDSKYKAFPITTGGGDKIGEEEEKKVKKIYTRFGIELDEIDLSQKDDAFFVYYHHEHGRHLYEIEIEDQSNAGWDFVTQRIEKFKKKLLAQGFPREEVNIFFQHKTRELLRMSGLQSGWFDGEFYVVSGIARLVKEKEEKHV